MPNESTTQMALVESPVFTKRVQYLLTQQARVVLAEIGVGNQTHPGRAAYARNVVTNPAPYASTASVMLVGGFNITSKAITGSGATADSAATDADILSQIATFWNALAGVDTGS
jgi:hypothetical protein